MIKNYQPKITQEDIDNVAKILDEGKNKVRNEEETLDHFAKLIREGRSKEFLKLRHGDTPTNSNSTFTSRMRRRRDYKKICVDRVASVEYLSYNRNISKYRKKSRYKVLATYAVYSNICRQIAIALIIYAVKTGKTKIGDWLDINMKYLKIPSLKVNHFSAKFFKIKKKKKKHLTNGGMCYTNFYIKAKGRRILAYYYLKLHYPKLVKSIE